MRIALFVALVSVATLVPFRAEAMCVSSNCICGTSDVATEVTVLSVGDGTYVGRVESATSTAEVRAGDEIEVSHWQRPAVGSRRFVHGSPGGQPAGDAGSTPSGETVWRDAAPVDEGRVSCERGAALGPFTLSVADALVAAENEDCRTAVEAAGFVEPDCPDTGRPFGCASAALSPLALLAFVVGRRVRRTAGE